MLRARAVLAGALTAGVGVTIALTVGRAGGPRHPALDAPAVVEIGEQEHGTVATARFTLRNAGGADLLLTDFRSDCACNALEVESGGRFTQLRELRLPAGEAAAVQLRKSVRGAAGQPIHSVVLFRTNAPDRPEAAVRVTVAAVRAGVTASPSHWTLGTVPQGRAARQEFTLTDSAIPPRTVDRVESSDPARLRAELTSDEPVS